VAGVAGLILLAGGCGKTQRPVDAPVLADAGGAGGDTASPDVPGGEGGGGAASNPAPTPDYEAILLDPLPTPAAPAGSLDGTEEIVQQLSPTWVSEDGSLIIGDSYTTYTRPDGVVAFSASRGFTWTEAGGLKPLLIPSGGTVWNACVAADGSSALITALPANDGARPTVYRWVAQRLESLPISPELGQGSGANAAARISLETCDAALTQASFRADERAYVWKLQGPIFEAPAPSGTLARQVLVSREGKQAVLNATAQGSTAPYRFDFTGAEQAALGAEAGSDCFATHLSDDGAAVLGACRVAGGTPGFYFDGQRFTQLDFTPLELSADGSVVWGMSGSLSGASELGFWSAGLGVLTPCQFAGSGRELVGSSSDGEHAFVNAGSLEAPAAQVCSQGRGVATLPLLPGRARARLTAISRNGAVQVGEQLAEGVPPDTSLGLPVLWDSQGARDVLAELKSAQVELPAAHLKLRRVWQDAKQVRILAKVSTPGRSDTYALLRLPTR
jgi:hypothetical protein